MACPPPASDAEAAYLAALARATAWEVHRDTLELRDAAGALLASFARR